MATTCEAIINGKVNQKGKPTIEWYNKNKKPMYYCYGYNDASTEEPLKECRECKKHVNFAQDDLDNYYKGINNDN